MPVAMSSSSIRTDLDGLIVEVGSESSSLFLSPQSESLQKPGDIFYYPWVLIEIYLDSSETDQWRRMSSSSWRSYEEQVQMKANVDLEELWMEPKVDLEDDIDMGVSAEDYLPESHIFAALKGVRVMVVRSELMDRMIRLRAGRE